MREKTKTQRMAEMIEDMHGIDEGVPSLIISTLARRHDIPQHEVERAYWGPYEEAMKKSNSQRMQGVDCHYCGGPATTFDFFDAPVCRGCGG
jgi:hypothetical protein